MKSLQHPSHCEFKRLGVLRGWLDLLERGPSEDEVLGTCITEANGGLHLVAGAGDVDDDPFTKDGMLDVVTYAQPHL